MREKIEKQMDEYMEKYLSLYPFSGSIAAIYKGEVVFNKAYGLASIELDVPNTPQTKHKIWSVTKQFTAAAILMLEERGLLKVEDSLKKYFSDCVALDERITIHHLLTHTSGLFNSSEIKDNSFHVLPQKTADLLKWHTALMGDKLLSHEYIDKMNTDYMNNYGYGVEVSEVDGKCIVEHGGGYEGFYAYLARRLDDDFAGAVITNYGFGEGVGILNDAIKDITLGNPYEMPAKPPVHEIDRHLLDEYIGKYEDEHFPVDYELKRVGDELHLIRMKYGNGPFILPVYPISDTELQHTWTDETYELGKTDDGIPTLLGIKKLDTTQVSLDESKNNNTI